MPAVCLCEGKMGSKGAEVRIFCCQSPGHFRLPFPPTVHTPLIRTTVSAPSHTRTHAHTHTHMHTRCGMQVVRVPAVSQEDAAASAAAPVKPGSKRGPVAATAAAPAPATLDRQALLYCERFIEYLVDLLSQLPTRRFGKDVGGPGHVGGWSMRFGAGRERYDNTRLGVAIGTYVITQGWGWPLVPALNLPHAPSRIRVLPLRHSPMHPAMSGVCHSPMHLGFAAPLCTQPCPGFATRASPPLKSWLPCMVGQGERAM